MGTRITGVLWDSNGERGGYKANRKFHGRLFYFEFILLCLGHAKNLAHSAWGTGPEGFFAWGIKNVDPLCLGHLKC